MSKAALNGDSLEVLLRRAAGSLLENLHADRAGVWASDASGGHVWHGQVAESEDLGSGLETSSINAFEVFPVEFNDANSPVEFFAPVFPAGPQQFFEGISTAIGMPLKVDDRLLGALLAGSIKPGKLAGRDVVENVAAEIALALYAIHARERQERTSKSLHLREEIDRLIAHGAAAESVISRILNAAVNETGAQFAGIARRLDTRAMRTNYDLIICDLRMPRVDGPAFYDALIRGRHTSRHRILFITGDTLGPRTIEFLQSRQLHYLAKPFLVEELKVAAYRVLEGDAVHPSAAAIAQANK